MEPIDQLRHDFARVVTILSRHHAYKEHDSLDEARILKVQVDDEPLEDVLVLFDQIFAELLEQFCVPLDNCLLFLTTLSLNFIVLFLEPVENSLELFPIGEDLDYGTQESTIDVLDQFLAIYIIDFLGVLQP